MPKLGKPINKMNDLQKLLNDNPDLAARARQRAGLAEVASLLLQLRSATGLTQRQLGERAGVTSSLISELENAANDGVTLRTLVRIAAGAGAKVELAFTLNAHEAGKVVTCLNTLGDGAEVFKELKSVQLITESDHRTALAA
jgi:transcriptional regulator with XRE-family HTH domain